MGWFEDLLEEQDIDILAWAMSAAIVPERWQGAMMRRLQALDYIRLP
jgi:antitoxin CptB